MGLGRMLVLGREEQYQGGMTQGLDKKGRETEKKRRSINFTQEENGKITPGRKRDPTPDSAIQAPNKQTSQTPTQTCKKHSCSPNRYNPSKHRRESEEDEEK